VDAIMQKAGFDKGRVKFEGGSEKGEIPKREGNMTSNFTPQTSNFYLGM
jgi:hypothetical protein